MDDAVCAAVQAADRVIMERSNGSAEEIEYLTAIIALKFAQRVAGNEHTKLLKEYMNLPSSRNSGNG
jgi:hypothetical protein